MEARRHILVAVDDTEVGHIAVDNMAVAIAGNMAANVCLTHVSLRVAMHRLPASGGLLVSSVALVRCTCTSCVCALICKSYPIRSVLTLVQASERACKWAVEHVLRPGA